MFNLTSRKSEKTTSPWSIFEHEMNDLFDRFSRDFSATGAPLLTYGPRIDVLETPHHFEIYAEIPGLLEKDLNVSLKDNNLIIRGERRPLPKVEGASYLKCELGSGSFYRSVPMSVDVDPEKVSASYKDGILMVTLQKLPEAQRKVKKIPVQIISGSSAEGSQKH